ncbi:Neurexin-1-alpha [Trachymyrmex cornetzi]|uniref:Neurexin-1-alpha n=1 Tax=Trachymyrmex cornetzi TaxID=471704 RepID=A0A195EBC9_9HYME|nr:Neurexin-1-alpha [Trachymyrmex cornetzi]
MLGTTRLARPFSSRTTRLLPLRSSTPLLFLLRPQSDVVLPPWKAAKTGTISFKIRTNEPNGLIMYSRSGAQTRVFDKSFSMVSKFKPIHLHLLVIPLTPTIRRQSLCARGNSLLYVEVAIS